MTTKLLSKEELARIVVNNTNFKKPLYASDLSAWQYTVDVSKLLEHVQVLTNALEEIRSTARSLGDIEEGILVDKINRIAHKVL